MHIYRWDLDRTYLDTDIGSVRGMLRTALEGAAEKRHVPGAPQLVRALQRWDPRCRIAILSGSPTQMRRVLEEKLALDGIRVDSFVLKNNLGNIRRGRFRAITGQIGYKLPQLLRQRVGLGSGVRETLFGDDTESDPLVYALYAETVAGRVSEEELTRVLEAGGAYSDAIDDALRAFGKIGTTEAVDDIFIHADKNPPLRGYDSLGSKVIPIFSWFQAALVLWHRGRLGSDGVADVARSCADVADLSARALAGLTQDIVRRRHLPREAVGPLLDASTGLAPAREAIERAVERVGPPRAPRNSGRPDFLEYLHAEKG